MNELSVGFSQDADTKVFSKTSLIHTSLTTAPGITFFPSPVPTMLLYKADIDAFGGVLNSENTAANVALRKARRDALILSTQKLAANLELTANGDLVALAASGFDLKTKPTRSTGLLPAPLDLRVKTTGIAGEALCKCKAVPLADSYEPAWTLDPTAGPWTSLSAVSSSQNLLFSGLQRGKDYFFRVRAIGANGPSPWSDVATMMVV
jgi:hypothetical protein